MLTPEERKKLEEQKKHHEENMSEAIGKGNPHMYKDQENKWMQCRKDLGEDIEEDYDNDCGK